MDTTIRAQNLDKSSLFEGKFWTSISWTLNYLSMFYFDLHFPFFVVYVFNAFACKAWKKSNITNTIVDVVNQSGVHW